MSEFRMWHESRDATSYGSSALALIPGPWHYSIDGKEVTATAFQIARTFWENERQIAPTIPHRPEGADCPFKPDWTSI